MPFVIAASNKRHPERDALGHVSWMREIQPSAPASAWLDAQELNKRFYDDLFAWFERACQQAQFLLAGLKMRKLEEHIIRLLTYLLFVWFLKEKDSSPL